LGDNVGEQHFFSVQQVVAAVANPGEGILFSGFAVALND
jgi:hypothetical protein